MGVNDATLFPDLRGLCDQIEQDYLIEDDERKPLYIRRKVKKFG